MGGNRKIIPADIGEYLNYDPDEGIFTWIVSPSNRVKVGQCLGNKAANGGITISFKGVPYTAARVAWRLHYNEDPGDKLIISADRDLMNLRIDNLVAKEPRAPKKRKTRPAKVRKYEFSEPSERTEFQQLLDRALEATPIREGI